MTLEEILTKLDSVLNEERKAIVGMNPDEIAALSKKKEALLARLATQPKGELKRRESDLERLRGGARENCLLLAHARDCVRDAIAAATDPASQPAKRLSISG